MNFIKILQNMFRLVFYRAREGFLYIKGEFAFAFVDGRRVLGFFPHEIPTGWLLCRPTQKKIIVLLSGRSKPFPFIRRRNGEYYVDWMKMTRLFEETIVNISKYGAGVNVARQLFPALSDLIDANFAAIEDEIEEGILEDPTEDLWLQNFAKRLCRKLYRMAVDSFEAMDFKWVNKILYIIYRAVKTCGDDEEMSQVEFALLLARLTYLNDY